jgi:hypothetical protein
VYKEDLDHFDGKITEAENKGNAATTSAEVTAAVEILRGKTSPNDKTEAEIGAIAYFESKKKNGRFIYRNLLLAAIDEAEARKVKNGATVRTWDAGENDWPHSTGVVLPAGTYWVTPEELSALNNAIAVARGVYSETYSEAGGVPTGATQVKVDAAIQPVKDAAATFATAAEKVKLDTSSLGNLIGPAETKKSGVVVSKSPSEEASNAGNADGKDWFRSYNWVSAKEVADLDAAIAHAKKASDDARTIASRLASELTALQAAIDGFTPEPGTRPSTGDISITFESIGGDEDIDISKDSDQILSIRTQDSLTISFIGTNAPLFWIIDGRTSQTAQGMTLTVYASNYLHGPHRVTAVVSVNGVYYSKSVTFRVGN